MNLRRMYRYVSSRLNVLMRTLDHENIYTYNQLQKFEAILNKHGMSLRQFQTIMDFGCGYGRMLRLIQKICPSAKLYGCEVDSSLLPLARSSCPNATIFENETAPPLPLNETVRFNLIYSYSVFTHLTEENHIAWLQELSSRLKPGGVMIHTVHTVECLKRMKMFSPERIKKYKINDLDDFIASPPAYHYVVDDAEKPDYGLTLMSKEYIRDTWPQYTGLKLIDFQEGCIEAYAEGCQDVVVLSNILC